MHKNVQLKLILLFVITGILIISTLSVAHIKSLELIGNQIKDIGSNQALVENAEIAIRNAKINMVIAIVAFGIAVIIMSIYLSKMVIYPLHKMIQSSKEEQAKNNADINNSIFLHMTDGIIAFDREGNIILVNPAAKSLLNIAPEYNTFSDVFDRFKLDINMEKIIYLESWTSTEQRIEVEDRFVNVFFAPYKKTNERNSGVIAVVQDITEHVKLDNMRKEFVADVSHELKTPITSIMGYADTLLEGDYDKETRQKFLNVIASEARRMARLVTDLLTLSRYDSNKNKLQKEKFDLGELVKKCQDKLAIEIKKKNHKVDCFVTADVPYVYADKDDIERVVLNILTNSIKYTGENGDIKIYVGFVYNDAYIKVLDNGIGIPEEDLGRIFERFYRVDKARSREMGGTGLGLSIAKELLDKNDGSIDIKSEVGKGTEVVIKIPTKVNGDTSL